MTLILMRLKQNMKKRNGKSMKLNNKHKSKVRRQVNIDLDVKPPKSIIFTSKKIYSRKNKHKLNTNEDG